MKEYTLNYIVTFFICFVITWQPYAQARSSFRKKDPTMPRIETCWQHDKKIYSLVDSHLEEYALFKTFDEPYFFSHALPTQEITYRNDNNKSVKGADLQKMVDELIVEIYAGKKHFKHFEILRCRDFNWTDHIGLIILKFKQHPFVVKLFMETPKSLANPHAKGFVPLFTFYMGGGINRHLIGFTRVKNLELVSQKIAQDPYWSTIVDKPRKWFVLPKKSPWIEITGYNIGNEAVRTKRLPGVYGIIADQIHSTTKTSMFNKHDNYICLNLCKYLKFQIDPHIDNFMWENETNKLVIVDTEHFPSFMGFTEEKTFNSYLEWLTHLAGKFLHDTFFRSKKDRRLCQLENRRIII